MFRARQRKKQLFQQTRGGMARRKSNRKAASPLTGGRCQGLAHVARYLKGAHSHSTAFQFAASMTLFSSALIERSPSCILSSCISHDRERCEKPIDFSVAAMAATQSSPSTATPSSLASRRPQARTALPPFTLPPQPSFPRAATAADTLSPPTSAASASGSTPRQPSASPSYSAESSPGYSTGATVLAHPHRAASLSPFQSHLPPPAGGAVLQPRRLAPRPPGPLSHPHDPKVTSIAAIANAAISNANNVGPDRAVGLNADLSTSPGSPPARRPLPGSPGAAGQFSPPRPAERLPPISSLISPMDRAGLGRLTVTVCFLFSCSSSVNQPLSRTCGHGSALCGQRPLLSRCRP